MEEWERKLRQRFGAMTGRQALKHMIKLQTEVRRLSFAVEAKNDENRKLKHNYDHAKELIKALKERIKGEE